MQQAKLQGARLAPSFPGDHTRQCRSQPGSQEPGRLRGGAVGEEQHEGENEEDEMQQQPGAILYSTGVVE